MKEFWALWVQSLGFRNLGRWLRVQGLGFRVKAVGLGLGLRELAYLEVQVNSIPIPTTQTP